MKSPIDREAVLTQLLATAIVWAAARYGLKVTDVQAFELAGIVNAALALFVRQAVWSRSSVAKLDEPEEEPTRYQAPLRTGNVTVHDPKRPAE